MPIYDTVNVTKAHKVTVFIEAEDGETYVLSCPDTILMETSVSWDHGMMPDITGYGPAILASRAPTMDRVTLSFKPQGHKPLTLFVNPTQADLLKAGA